MLATATVIAQEYHGEMERLYPDKTKTTKKTTKKTLQQKRKRIPTKRKPPQRLPANPQQRCYPTFSNWQTNC